VVAIATGGAHSCALMMDGTVWCWGANGNLQLGDGSITKSTTPITVRSLSNVTSIASFGYFTCAVLTDTTVKCWGDNDRGQLGRDTSLGNTPASIPAPVTDLGNVVAVATGGSYTCARVTDGTVKCWGANDRSQLGPNVPIDPSTSKPFQKSVLPVAVGLSNVAALAADSDYTCALLTDSTVKCWGATFPTPVDVGLTEVIAIAVGGDDCAILKNGTVSCSGHWLFSSTRQPVELNSQATAIAHSCAVLTDGTVWCWERFSPPVKVNGLQNVIAITAGGSHSCVLLADGTVSCWGANSSGQLGNGTTDDSSIPQVVIGLNNVAAVAAGNQHTCARLTDGTVSCWGENRGGELGNGAILSTLHPVKVVGIP